jgi:hypothetical protein
MCYFVGVHRATSSRRIRYFNDPATLRHKVQSFRLVNEMLSSIASFTQDELDVLIWALLHLCEREPTIEALERRAPGHLFWLRDPTYRRSNVRAVTGAEPVIQGLMMHLVLHVSGGIEKLQMPELAQSLARCVAN